MLTKEENELLTRVGPGTPCGELLRRYWQPVGYVRDFTPQQPIKRVKVMHEELVVFRTLEGEYGCLGEHCSHRGTSLAYGFVEKCGLRCPYHGWKYAPSGQCLEQPFEPAGSTYKERIKHPAYPVQVAAGAEEEDEVIAAQPAARPPGDRWPRYSTSGTRSSRCRREPLARSTADRP
jgi:5,5'-dehydrodivanillate O-demethylase